MSESLYIPGLGNGRLSDAQKKYVAFLNRLRSPKRHIDFFDARWETAETYEEKYARLRAYAPRKVFAISAGSSLAVRLAAEDPRVEEVHLICGKVTGAEKIGPQRQQQAPALLPSVRYVEQLIDGGLSGEKFTCYVPNAEDDGVLETVDMVLPNAKIVKLPPLNHAFAISYALVRHVP